MSLLRIPPCSAKVEGSCCCCCLLRTDSVWEMPFSPVGSLSVCKQAFRVLGNFGCSQEILSIAAMMQIQNVFVFPSNQKSQAVSPASPQALHTVLLHILVRTRLETADDSCIKQSRLHLMSMEIFHKNG